ncbi:hypothetical protein KGF56_002768, partial [Candida oxycetoniae]
EREENGLVKTQTNNSTFSITETNDCNNVHIEENDGLFSFVASNKKTKYKKLVVAKADLVKQIMKLNIDLKWSHEIIATEISSFMKFRGQFLSFALKRFVSQEIKSLKSRDIELRKVLYNVKQHNL